MNIIIICFATIIGVAAGSVTRMAWNPKINQIIVGCSENVHVFFDPEMSKVVIPSLN